MRLHLMDPNPNMQLPSVEGLLMSKRPDEFVIGAPSLVSDPSARPAELMSRELRVLRERVAFYEVLR